MEIHGKKIITRGVPAGYGYIHKSQKRQGWTFSKFWPVKLIEDGRDFEYFRDGEFLMNRYSRKDCLAAINEAIES